MADVEVVIVTGPPGAGKSTTARTLARSFPKCVHLHTDSFWDFIASGRVAPYLAEADGQNHTVMQAISGAAAAYARGGYVVVVDGIIGPWMLPHFRGDETLQRLGLHYVVLRPSRTATLQRAQGRAAPEALVDEEPIVSLWDQFADLGDLEAHAMDTTAQTCSETADVLRARLDQGLFRLS